MTADIKIKFLETNREKVIPFYATPGSAGMDLTACLSEDVTLEPLERRIIPTGIAIQLPSADFAAFVFARSGLASKKGITLPNCVGVIDSDYTGELMVSLINLSRESYTIKNGERIAQLVVMEVAKANFSVVEQLGTTQRGDGGFGSTGHF